MTSLTPGTCIAAEESIEMILASGAIDRDEPGLEDVRQPDVGHVFLESGHPSDAADAVGRRSNEMRRHRWPPSATARMASVIWT